MAMRGWVFVATALVACLWLGAGAAAQVDEETARLFQEAIELYQRGRDAEALEKLKQVLARDPSNEEAFALRQRVAFNVWVDLMVKRGEHRAVIAEFLRRAAVGERQKKENPEAVAALLEQLRTGGYAAQEQAAATLEREFGDFAVPAIVANLARTGDEEYRLRLLQLLARMGPEATWPLVECLDSGDLNLKRFVCVALGLIRDERAAPFLKAVTEAGEDVALVTQADRALRKLGLPAAQLARPAKELFVGLAARYYRHLPEVLKEFSADRVLWRWQGDGLTHVNVPVYLYALEVAKELCYRALQQDPTYGPAQVWLARAHLAAITELEAAAAAGNETAKALAERMAKARALAASAGVENLEEALRACIREKDLAVAEAAIFTLGDLLTPRTFQGGALAEALAAPYKVLRYAAAIQIGRLAPSPGFPNADRVVPELSRCVAESTLRTILVIDDDLTTRNQLLTELRELGYYAFGAESGEAGLLLAKRPPTPDLILLKTTLGAADETRISAQGLVKELKEDVRTRDIPILGLAPEARAEADQALFGDRLAGIVKIPLVKETYAAQIKEALPERSAEEQKALRFARLAAEALARLAATMGTLDASAAAGNLMATLAEKPDDVKLPAIQALGHLGSTEAVPALIQAFRNEELSAPVRAAAAVAVGRITRSAGRIEADVYQALLEGLGAADRTVAEAAGRALGIAPLSPAQRAEVAVRHRLAAQEVFRS